MSKIKTATVTWISYKNFGTYLQAYALQQILLKLGFENDIISDKKIVKRHEKETSGKNSFSFFLAEITRPLRKFFQASYEQKRIIQSCYKDFAHRYLKINYEWKKFRDLDNKYDVYINGSDQIWSPLVPFDPFYFLGFTSKSKIAYAPSLGVSIYPKEMVAKIKPLLEDFSALSVRENQGHEILKDVFGLDCQTVVDPTLLLNKDEWNSFAVKKKFEEHYVLCYLLSYNEIYLKFISSFAKCKKLPLKIFITEISDTRLLNFADQPLYVGPGEFINYIYNSDYFFTDSFHGCVFAIHFEKTFFALKRFSDKDKKNQNSRIDNLFHKLGINDRFFSEHELNDIYHCSSLDYGAIKRLLTKEREMSLDYLKESLKQVCDD